jgi:DNA-binding CsgD family transcriptional regulator
MARTGRAAAALRATVTAPSAVRRYAELLEPAGIHDELRVRLELDGEQWGTAILYRLTEPSFSAEEVALAEVAAPLIARAVRTGLLQAVCDSPHLECPPGSLLLGPDDDVVVTSSAAEQLLSLLGDGQAATVLRNLAAVTRTRGAASLTVTSAGGVVTLHGSPATGMDGAVAGVIERPRPVQLAPLIMRAAGLTAREREVAEALLQGTARNRIARRLQVSEQTVADHLRSLYRKTGVAGRAELAALLFGRHYEQPRADRVPPSPYGFFVGPVDQPLAPPLRRS